jgi:hypothetical protein
VQKAFTALEETTNLCQKIQNAQLDITALKAAQLKETAQSGIIRIEHFRKNVKNARKGIIVILKKLLLLLSVKLDTTARKAQLIISLALLVLLRMSLVDGKYLNAWIARQVNIAQKPPAHLQVTAPKVITVLELQQKTNLLKMLKVEYVQKVITAQLEVLLQLNALQESTVKPKD